MKLFIIYNAVKIPVLPSHPGAGAGQRAGAPQPVRGGGGARPPRRRRAVPRARRRARPAGALHTAPSGGRARKAGRRLQHPRRPLGPPRRRHLRPPSARRGARALELHPPATPRPPRDRPLVAKHRLHCVNRTFTSTGRYVSFAEDQGIRFRSVSRDTIFFLYVSIGRAVMCIE